MPDVLLVLADCAKMVHHVAAAPTQASGAFHASVRKIKAVSEHDFRYYTLSPSIRTAAHGWSPRQGNRNWPALPEEQPHKARQGTT